MSNFTEQLRLKEMAEEDIYFARLDRELIKALQARLKSPEPPRDKRESRPH